MKKAHHYVIVLCVFCVYLCVSLFTFQIRFTPNNGSFEQEYGEPYETPNVRATLSNMLIPFLHIDLPVTSNSDVDTYKEGTNDITFSSGILFYKKEKEAKVIVKDTTAPTITLLHKEDYYTPYNHPYEEEGYTAIDTKDGDVSDQVVREVLSDRVVYRVKDNNGNQSEVERLIPYDDRLAPVFDFGSDEREATVYLGDAFSKNVTAYDDVDGDVTGNIQVSGEVNTSLIDDYVLTYEVKDAHNNVAKETYTVHVRPLPVNKHQAEDAKTIYLTFDDGPGPYSEKLLNILDKYNVKATFFTTSIDPDYRYLIQEEAKRGHSIGVHTYSHDYAAIYSSSDAYWQDIHDQLNVIMSQTQTSTNLLRFAGGSSNTVSKSYCPGIMTQLQAEVSEKGFVYFDWNISSGDADGIITSKQVFENVKEGVLAYSGANRPSLVLQHDTKAFSVDAVEDIIVWGLENGFHFEALSQSSYASHHKIAN